MGRLCTLCGVLSSSRARVAVLALGEGYLEEILDDGLFDNQLRTNMGQWLP